MPHPNERPEAQTIAKQLLAGADPGSMATFGLPRTPDHEGKSHPYGGHMGAAYVRGDGTVFSTVSPDNA